MGLKDSTIAKVREVPLTGILDSEEIPFKKIGREAVTLCPWHSDTNPSLTVNDEKNICFCFACGGGSDGIAFVQQRFGLSFSDAVIRIAEKHNIVVEYDNLNPEEALKKAQERRAQIARLERLQSSYRNELRNDAGIAARDWLVSRGIEPGTSREFGLGCSSFGYLAGRVTVPIHNHNGTLVGFTGRDITGLQEQKYKNSASSDVFDKSALLFNEHRAFEAAKTMGYMIFVEGHFDVISLYQAGIKNVVAVQGTAGPRIETLRRVLRRCRRFVLCYDGDQGGHKAVELFVKVAGPLACEGELTLSVARLPAGMDPDDCVKSGIDVHALVEGAPQWLDWQIDYWLASVDRSDVYRFSQIEKAIRDLVASIKSPALRQFYIDKAAKVLASDSASAAKLAQSWNEGASKARVKGQWAKPEPGWVRTQVERRMIRSYIHFPETRERLRNVGHLLELPSHLWLWARLAELERLQKGWNKESVMAILACSEPHYMRTLRALVMPTIRLENQDGILSHIEAVLQDGEAELPAGSPGL